jgi:hypothetical protein
LSDFYRELGDIFSISFRVSNRWGGFKALRARWLDHLGSASRRPVVLVDEAQEMTPMVLSELRLLASARFDSQSLLCVAAQREITEFDEKLYLQVFAPPETQTPRRSLRSGFMTEAGRQNVPLAEAMAPTGHRSVQTALRYFQTGAVQQTRATTLLTGAPPEAT